MGQGQVTHSGLGLQTEEQYATEYLSFLESPERVIEKAPTGDSTVLLGDLNTHTFNDRNTWKGMIRSNSIPDLNLMSILLLGFSASHSVHRKQVWP